MVVTAEKKLVVRWEGTLVLFAPYRSRNSLNRAAKLQRRGKEQIFEAFQVRIQEETARHPSVS